LGYVAAGDVPKELGVVLAVMTALMGSAMVANFKYPSFKGLDFRGRVPFVVIFIIVIVFSLVTLHPPAVFLATFLVYALSSPVLTLVNRLRPVKPVDEGEQK
jgi:CDP-diacylglycerol--serine O-phosphatidyltransferase